MTTEEEPERVYGTLLSLLELPMDPRLGSPTPGCKTEDSRLSAREGIAPTSEKGTSREAWRKSRQRQTCGRQTSWVFSTGEVSFRKLWLSLCF